MKEAVFAPSSKHKPEMYQSECSQMKRNERKHTGSSAAVGQLVQPVKQAVAAKETGES